MKVISSNLMHAVDALTFGHTIHKFSCWTSKHKFSSYEDSYRDFSVRKAVLSIPTLSLFKEHPQCGLHLVLIGRPHLHRSKSGSSYHFRNEMILPNFSDVRWLLFSDHWISNSLKTFRCLRNPVVFNLKAALQVLKTLPWKFWKSPECWVNCVTN